jgi:hypothetical protein
MWIALGIIGTLWIVGMANLPNDSAKSAQASAPAATHVVQAQSDHAPTPGQ